MTLACLAAILSESSWFDSVLGSTVFVCLLVRHFLFFSTDLSGFSTFSLLFAQAFQIFQQFSHSYRAPALTAPMRFLS
jgi:hypothetical protein